MDDSHSYLGERGLAQDTIEYFGIGHCKRGLMKGRVAIPIHNEQGELVAYAGRWAGETPEGQERYLLPSGFHKSVELFNIHSWRRVPAVASQMKCLQNRYNNSFPPSPL